MKTLYLFIIISISSISNTNAQQFTLSGYIKDKSSGEILIGANVYIKGQYIGTSSNEYGFYSLSLVKGQQQVVYNYLGYNAEEIEINITDNIEKDVELTPTLNEIEEITVRARRDNENIVSPQMSNVALTARTIKQIPVLMGETDIIKTLQLLPGIKTTGGLSSGMSVRGGGRDQNLILLDEAIVYNSGHLGGIFSVFNNDAIKNLEIYKGFIPAEYGGRLSSVLDIRMKDGNAKKFTGNGGIGLISSRLTLEAPVANQKGSFLLSGRRTYLDVILKAAGSLSKNENIIDFPLHFYDLNAKINYNINNKNKVYLSGYFGRDVFAFSLDENTGSGFNWGNYTGTFRWNHIFNGKLFSNYTFLVSNYDYLMSSEFKLGREKKEFSFEYDAFIQDVSGKIDFGYYINQNNTLKFGAISTYHDIKVGEIQGQQDTLSFNFKLPAIPGIESALYLRNNQKIGNHFAINYGLRYAMFFNPGKNDINIVENYKVNGEAQYEWKDTYYGGFEPRFGLSFILNNSQSVKLGYTRTRQYMLVASNSSTGNPLDVWISTNPNIKPQISDQYSAGFFKNLAENNIETSVEVYYKASQNTVTFKEFAQPQFNEYIEEDLRFGKGRAFGIELLLKKPEGRINGWIGYEWSRSELKIKDIDEKGWFFSPYDSPHDFTIVAIFDWTRRLSISANWLYKSGQPFNAPARRTEYGGLILPVYPGRNMDRLPDYHRMDLGVTLKEIFAYEKSRYQDELVFSVYNVYMRKNADIIDFDQSEADSYITKAIKYTYIPFFPSVTYNFKF